MTSRTYHKYTVCALCVFLNVHQDDFYVNTCSCSVHTSMASLLCEWEDVGSYWLSLRIVCHIQSMHMVFLQSVFSYAWRDHRVVQTLYCKQCMFGRLEFPRQRWLQEDLCVHWCWKYKKTNLQLQWSHRYLGMNLGTNCFQEFPKCGIRLIITNETKKVPM